MGTPFVISPRFRQRLETSNLTGFRCHPLEIGCNQSEIKDPKLFLLEFTGTIWERPLQIVGLPNACPHCGYAPLICPECGHSDDLCPHCHQQQSKLPKTAAEQEDTYLRQADVPRKGRILLGKTWTGEDFVESRRSRFITKRALGGC